MKALIKAEMIRLYKNKLFVGGNVLAFVITVVFCNTLNTLRPTQSGINNFYANFVSLGIMAFFSLFTALYVCDVYSGGVIRNRVIAGHKQLEIFGAGMIAIFAGILTMTASWFAGCLVSGYALELYTIKYVLVLLFACIAYGAILTAISMRVQRSGVACAITLMLFFVSYVVSTGVHAAYVWTEGSASTVWKVLLDVMPMGQWWAIWGRDGAELPMVLMILISLGITILAYLIGTVGINKRELN